MGDTPEMYRGPGTAPVALSAAQRAFVEGAGALNATTPASSGAGVPGYPRWTRDRLVKSVLFWIIVILIPILMIYTTNRR